MKLGGTRASQLTLAASIVFTCSTIAAVYYIKDIEFTARRLGILRDVNKLKRLNNIADMKLQEKVFEENTRKE